MIDTIRHVLQEFLNKNNFNNVNFILEMPKFSRGNISTNILLILKNKYQVDMTENLREFLIPHAYISSIEIINNFVNIFLKSSIIKNLDFSFPTHNTPISIEYTSPNATGPLHLGHARGTVIGDTLSNIFTYMGYKVCRDFYFNDGGNQIHKFMKSIYIRYKEIKYNLTGEDIFYKGDYVKKIAQQYIHGDYSYEEFDKNFRQEILGNMKNDVVRDLELMNIKHDFFTYESALISEGQNTISLLENKQLVEKIDGKILFKSTLFDDDKDRVIMREDGTCTYFGNDITYHITKLKRGFHRQIIVLGDDHIGYLKRLSATVKNFDVQLQVVTHNLVKIFKDQQEFKMSKRNGTFIKIRDFIHDHGSDLLKVSMLSQNYNTPIHIDLNHLNLENSQFFYIKYVYDRLTSIIHAQTLKDDNINLEELNTKEDKDIITCLLWWKETVKNISVNLEVNLFLLFIINFCKNLHIYWNNIKNENFSNASLFLMIKSHEVLSISMKILNINKK